MRIMRDKTKALIKEQEESRRLGGIQMKSFLPTKDKERPRHESDWKAWQDLFRSEFYAEILALLTIKAGLHEDDIEKIADNVFLRLGQRKEDCVLALEVVGKFIEILRRNLQNTASAAGFGKPNNKEK